MTTEAAYYDQAMTGDGAPAMVGLADSPWRPLYREAARWIPDGHDVVDLGCGTGRFLAELLLEPGRTGSAMGVDFSELALAEARRYVPNATFSQTDLRTWGPDPARAGHTSYTCLEVLEHLDDDLDLIRRVPPGHQLVFSVPNYESEAHLRTFTSPGAVWHRYGPLVSFRRWSLIELDDRKCIHVLDTIRRVDAW